MVAEGDSGVSPESSGSSLNPYGEEPGSGGVMREKQQRLREVENMGQWPWNRQEENFHDAKLTRPTKREYGFFFLVAKRCP